MNHSYDASTALHYAAYRPPLHRSILEEILENQTFEAGLDVGCGTGQSSLALKDRCGKVLAVDSSLEMISHALKQEGITYRWLTDLLQIDGQYDVITFAGSWPYVSSQNLVFHLNQLLKNHGLLIIYDFAVQLHRIWNLLDISVPDDSTAYDHKADLSHFKVGSIKLLKKKEKTATISASFFQVLHLIMSVSSYRLRLTSQYGQKGLQQVLEKRWEKIGKDQLAELPVSIYYTLYQKDNS
ncbi:MAG: methyltransferase domain-containing protein [Saprospiraceae bacterium]|nr:methyltransferase domain-containing protein [Saprospiraceae bacterium]